VIILACPLLWQHWIRARPGLGQYIALCLADLLALMFLTLWVGAYMRYTRINLDREKNAVVIRKLPFFASKIPLGNVWYAEYFPQGPDRGFTALRSKKAAAPAGPWIFGEKDDLKKLANLINDLVQKPS